MLDLGFCLCKKTLGVGSVCL